MTDVHQALYRFWSSFGVPAYLSGHVPDGASVPYITFEVGDGEPFSSTFLVAIVWAADNATRAALLDKIAEAIGADGTTIALDGGGMLALYRNAGGFMSYYDDPEDKTILGGRVSYQVNFYHL